MRSSARLTIAPAEPVVEPLDRRRPNVSGDLRLLFSRAPVFRRRPAGYDRFQVDTYVRWAEEELAAAGHERDEVLLRHARLRADLDEARRLLVHTGSGRESLQLSSRIGSVLAAAADEADGIRADAQAARAHAEAEAQRVLAEAAAEAERLVADATAQAARLIAEADGMRTEAEQVLTEARIDADARLVKVREMEKLAEQRADQLRQDAARDAETARLQARDEVMRMLVGAREERRRSEERRAGLQAQLAVLEQRLAEALEPPPVAVPVPVPVPVPRDVAPVEVVVDGGRRAGHLPHFGRRLRRG